MSNDNLKKHELILRVTGHAGPDPEVSEWNQSFWGEPLQGCTWPQGSAPIIYFYLWAATETDVPNILKPDDLFYLGERSEARNFKRGWVPLRNDARRRWDSKRYPWLPHVQNRTIFAVAYELPLASGYSDQTKRRSLEYLIARKLTDHYGDCRHLLKFTKRFDFRFPWLRSTDLKRDTSRILEDLDRSYFI